MSVDPETIGTLAEMWAPATMRRPSTIAMLLITVVVAIGCGSDETSGVALSGRVSYRGRPIEDGMIFFHPEVSTPSRTGVAQIQKGIYSIPAQQGPQKGDFRIEIYSGPVDKWYDETSPGSIPGKYNAKSILRLTIPRRKSIEFNFALE